MNKELFVTAAIIAAITVLLLIGGCVQQPQQKPEAQSPQQQPPQTQPEKQPEQAATPPELQQPALAAEAEAAQHDLLGKPKSAAADWAQSQQRLGGQSKTEEDDLYKDNLDGSLDDLSQLEQ